MKRRARSDVQKAERRRAILDAGLALFAASSYEAVTMTAVAERAGLAKGTLYLYFRTKEELFAALQADQLAAWFDEVDARLERLPERSEPQAIARLFAASLEHRPELVRLLAILQSVLEQNIDLATAVAFKRMLAERIGHTGRLLEGRLGFLRPGEGGLTLLRIHALVVGLQHLADPAPVAREAIREPGLDMFQVDLVAALEATLRLILRGMEAER
jgi:AcrR family transcriptional regulator